MRHSIIRNGVVENVVEWDGKTPWTPPDGTQVIQTDDGPIGHLFDGAKFTAPPEVPTPPKSKSKTDLLVERINALEARVKQLGG